MFETYVNNIKFILGEILVTDKNGSLLSVENAFKDWIKLTYDNKISNNSIFFIGNGASSAMSSHMSADATKNGKLSARSLIDQSIMTAISNDIDYTEIFSLQLERYSHPGDILIAISSSGNSPNILNAVLTAKKSNMKIITLSGMTHNNKLRNLGDINFYVPGSEYGHVECAHQVVLHYWLDAYILNHVDL